MQHQKLSLISVDSLVWKINYFHSPLLLSLCTWPEHQGPASGPGCWLLNWNSYDFFLCALHFCHYHL